MLIPEILAAGLTPVLFNLLINKDKNGTSFIQLQNHTAIDMEKTDDGTIKLLPI